MRLLPLLILCTLPLFAQAPAAPAKPAAPARVVPQARIRDFKADTTSLQPGQSTLLRWNVENPNSTTISGLGNVTASGSRRVTPKATTTYTITVTTTGSAVSVDVLDQLPGVKAVSPVISGPAFARRGGTNLSVALVGVGRLQAIAESLFVMDRLGDVSLLGARLNQNLVVLNRAEYRIAADPSADLSSLRGILCGGAAVPRSMIEAFQSKFGVEVVQGWGMTETSPLAAVSIPPYGSDPAHEVDYRVKAGRVVAGVQLRIVDDAGDVLPRDGKSVGEFEIAGPWITGSYYGVEAPDKFHEGWLRTGDVGTLDGEGFMVISDRSKDVIKSGGEWISSVELENEVIAHEGVFEAAVVAVPDARWDERPLCCVVRNPESQVTAEELREFLSSRVAKWWIPERWAFIDSVPKTSTGKFDKKVLRAAYAASELEVVQFE